MGGAELGGAAGMGQAHTARCSGPAPAPGSPLTSARVLLL